MHKNIFISDIVLGDTVSDLFLLTGAMQGQSRNGPYWAFEFRDATGFMKGKMWSPQSLKYPEVPIGEIIHVTAKVTSYRGVLELAVNDLQLLSDGQINSLELGNFVTASPFSPDVMFSELKQLCFASFTHEAWQRFIFSLLEDEEIAAKLLVAPAAKSMHHAYAGGLLEHTLSVCRLCLLLADHYPKLDRQTLLAGALCHDLGKIWELTSGMTIEYTASGHLLGHIVLLLNKIRPFLDSSGLEPELAQHLQHLIVSHHGTLEYGSPKLPATAEALVLHYADNIDAKMQQSDNALASVEEGKWSSRVFGLDRMLYRSVQTPLPESSKQPFSVADEVIEQKSAIFPPEWSAPLATEGASSGVEPEQSLASSTTELLTIAPEALSATVSKPPSEVFASDQKIKGSEQGIPSIQTDDADALLFTDTMLEVNLADSWDEACASEPGNGVDFSIVDASAPGVEALLVRALAGEVGMTAKFTESMMVTEKEISERTLPEREKAVTPEEAPKPEKESKAEDESGNTATDTEMKLSLSMRQEIEQETKSLPPASEDAIKEITAPLSSLQKDAQPLSVSEQCLLLSKE